MRLYHATNVWPLEGGVLRPSPARIVENGKSGSVLFASHDPTYLSCLAFKSQFTVAHRVNRDCDDARYKWVMLVTDIEEYLRTINHIGRLITLPESATDDFVQEHDRSGRPLEKWTSRVEVPIEDCEVAEVTLRDVMNRGMKVFYLKNSKSGDTFLQEAREAKRVAFSPGYLRESVLNGTVGYCPFEEVAEIRANLGLEF
ncbi:hypothetical protein MK489_19530 [Myxococcota bacterium]|nr:hypothetical protein [Myxococcota bacterium]